jgi:ABC-type branched-subunit amino acid transport system substrate-binding protein
MISSRRTRLWAFAAVGALALAACGSDSDSASSDTEAPAGTEAPAATDAPATEETTAPEEEGTDTTAAEETEESEAPAAGDGWTVNTDDCVDPDLANEPIEGAVSIGSVMPLSGGAAATAFAPVADGFNAYIKYANENGLLEGHEIQVSIEDDQYSKDLTPGAVESLLDNGVHLFSGIIGSPNNAAVRDLLNEECVPQLNALTGSPQWGEVADYPWTTGALIPYPTEVQGYFSELQNQFPDGGTLALFSVNNEFGQFYVDAVKEFAADAGFEIVDEQTIEATETAPPTAQVNSIASKAPDAIMAVPLGAQCATFQSEVANAKAANSGWNPPVFLTNTCASSLILAISGPAANGLYTSASGGIADIGNPEVVASNPDYQAYVDYMTAEGKADIITTAAAGWTVGEVTVAILKQAAESPEGLTRASIINAARNFTFEPSLVRDGVVYKMSGEEDPFLVEAIQIVQYDQPNAIFTDIGPLVLDYESS